MFWQILVQEEDHHLQAIVWRGGETEKNETFFLTTVTFGLASSSYLASRMLRQLAQDERASFPLGSSVIDREVYAGDVLSGDFTLDDVKTKQKRISDLLRSSCFKLRNGYQTTSIFLTGSLPAISLLF